MTGIAPAPVRAPRPNWPLYLAAGLAFVPFVGFFWGSVAVSWGLVSSRTGARRAVAIAAAGALLNLVGMFVLLSSNAGNAAYREAVNLGVRQRMGDIVAALEEYHEQEHRYPATLAQLNRFRGPLRPMPVADQGPGVFRMRLSQPYQYSVSTDGESYDLFSVGKDGVPGTSDDLRPLVPDSLEGKTGLRAP